MRGLRHCLRLYGVGRVSVEAGFVLALGQYPLYESFQDGRYRLRGCLVKRLYSASWWSGGVAATRVPYLPLELPSREEAT